ncbi:MAG: aspartate carbamoyltransferase, partial [Chloroflexota bacterium]|nr:aspartate carbamoyltransferase [Chloroflexota bacterium]
MGRHLLDVDDLGADGLERVLEHARWLGALSRSDAFGRLLGRTVVNLFYEPSTRTRVSFEVAARRLGAEVVNISATGSSVEKGETLIDTMRTLEAAGADALVVRHSSAGAPYLLARSASGSVINAGDGLHAHPT